VSIAHDSELATVRLAELTWSRARLEKAEQQFLPGAGVLVGTVKNLSEEDRQQLTVEAMSTEAGPCTARITRGAWVVRPRRDTHS